MAVAAGSIALSGLAGCSASGARAAPEAITRVPLASVPDGQRLKIDHHGEPVELQRVGQTVTALSLICTHQYCRMFWHPATNAYRCPCHGGQFAADGSPLSGPVTQPMFVVPARIEGDQIVIGGIS